MEKILIRHNTGKFERRVTGRAFFVRLLVAMPIITAASIKTAQNVETQIVIWRRVSMFVIVWGFKV
jgi:hypothetical protein